MASISSMNMMHGAVFLAAANSSRTLFRASDKKAENRGGGGGVFRMRMRVAEGTRQDGEWDNIVQCC